jgi:long-chain acyl-CoA synthetase
VSDARTLPGLLEEQAAARPKAVAIRKKQLGIWRELTWSEYAQAVREVALGLDELGVGAGDRVVIFADNGPRWLFSDLGVQALGAWSVGVYTGLELPAVSALVNASGAAIVICGDQEQVDEVLEVRDELPGLEKIIVFDTKGLHTPDYEGAPIETFDGLRARGRALHEERPGRYAELLGARGPDDVALLALTSGTTGTVPRGALLSQGGEAAMARIVAGAIGLAPRDRSFSLLPLPHATARLFDVYAPLVAGSTTNFAESSETVLADLVEIAPTVVVGTTRLLERLRGDVELRMERASRLKRTLYRWSMQRMTAAARKNGSSVGSWLGWVLVGRWIVDKAGLSKLRYGGISGSVVAPELLTWFWALRQPMREQYGQVETGGIVSTQRGPEDAGTAGPPIHPDVQVRVTDDGELLVRSPGLLVDSFGDDAGSGLDDGWFHTGDLARIDEQGRIVPLGRRAHVLVTASGEEISPAEIESTLKISPYVGGAMILADARPYVTALLEIHQEAASEWARHQGLAVTTYASLVGNERVTELVAAQVAEANASLPPERQVREFRLLPTPLDEELTPTGKIKRAVLEERYAQLIDEMYAGQPVTPGAAG